MIRKKYTYQDIKNIVEEARYELISKEEDITNNKGFVLTKTYIEVWCKNPNHKSYKVEFNKFKGYNGQNPTRCKQCLADELRTSLNDVKKIFEREGYKLLSKYKTNNTPLVLECPNGHITNTMTYARFKDGSRCCECGRISAHNKQRHSYEYIKQYIESFDYKLLSTEYNTARKPITVQCPYGHKPYTVRFDNFKTGYRCPYCNISKGEQEVMDYLDKNNIKYIYNEPYFNDLLSPLGNPLRPDFIIEDRKIWIEYDGEFHYKKYYEEQNFEQIKIHDNMKDEYAKKHGWKMIRIPYWDYDNIEEILDKELNLR